MSSPEGWRLDEFARGPLAELVESFRRHLLAEAARIAGSKPINAGDLATAYRSIVGTDRVSLQGTQEIISTALRENRLGEWTAYGMSAILFLAGLVLLILGGVHNQLAGVAGGSAAEAFVFLALRVAINIRRHNIALRILGKLLDRVTDPKALAVVLKETFPEVVHPKPDRG